MASEKRICVINGSLSADGNTARVLREAELLLEKRAKVTHVNLTLRQGFHPHKVILEASDGFLFGTGTYWDSWGSPLQSFLEQATETEGGPLWLGKPAAIVITMHSVGGKSVLSRLQGVLNTFGLLLPPMSGLVYSRVNQSALKSGDDELLKDLYSPADLDVLCHNLVTACHGSFDWKRWEVDERGFRDVWFKASSD